MLWLFFIVFFFKQKTAYEMRISDWSSDVCSSDLSYWMFSAVVAGQYLGYLDDQYAFMEALPGRVREKIVVRLNAGEGGWSQGARMRDRLPGAQRSDERRVGKECVRTVRSRGSTYH